VNSAPSRKKVQGKKSYPSPGNRGKYVVTYAVSMRHLKVEPAREMTMVKWVVVLEDIVNAVSASVLNRDSGLVTWAVETG
jgi:hypothetical protein